MINKTIDFFKSLFKRKPMRTLLTDKTETHSYPGTPFSIEMTPVDHGTGYWNTWEVKVLREGVHIGGYERRYSSFVDSTFCPFQKDGVWYALYSADYTTTRVAKLTDTFEDWCGESGHAFGFCPTKFYVPAFFRCESDYVVLEEQHTYTHTSYFDREWDDYEEYSKELLTTKENPKNRNFHTGFANWGLLAGCVWGDDNSWKVRHIDLSKIEDKELKITDKFGYFELPDGKTLRQSVEVVSDGYIQLDSFHRFDLRKNYEIECNEVNEDGDPVDSV